MFSFRRAHFQFLGIHMFRFSECTCSVFRDTYRCSDFMCAHVQFLRVKIKRSESRLSIAFFQNKNVGSIRDGSNLVKKKLPFYQIFSKD